ncbi:MAG TPA: HAMP domain-containing sensor histidine kinase [Candidatus Acidoferrales bacterium]|nr:HAMP domain-containing sensor histidine kinase [Candidatus Acidoferrales bacterium]
MNIQRAFAGAFEDKRKALINLQWLVVIVTSYLSVFSGGTVVADHRVYALIGALLASVAVLHRLSPNAFEHRYFAPGLVVVDTLLIGCGIALNQDRPWDLFLLFFFAIFIAAIGESLVQIVGICLVASVIFIVVAQAHGGGLAALEWDALLRIPFVFGVSVLYGYMAEQTRREKSRLREEGDKIKAEFLSVMSHELRTPLNVIMNYAAMMQKGVLGELNPEQKRAVEKMTHHSRELLGMINDILEITRLGAEAVKLERHRFHLSHLLDDIRAGYEIPLDKDVKLCWDYSPELPVIETDAGKLRHILWNLINNAIKFTDAGRVTVAARANERAVELSVSDTGIGIPKKDLAKIFEIFHQADSSAARDYGGAGVGLHIVKRFTEMLGGAIRVESEENRGSTFTVTLPYAPEPVRERVESCGANK